MSGKKKILIFIDWFLPGYKAGGPIRSVANIVDSLHTDLDFFIITSDRDLGDKSSYKNIELNTEIKNKNYTITYLSLDSQNIKSYKKLIIEVKPDKIYFNGLFSLKFTLLPLFVSKKLVSSNSIIIAPRGMLGIGALGLKRYKKFVFLKISKILKLYSGITWHATTADEATDIKKVFNITHRLLIAGNIPLKPEKHFQKEKEAETKFVFISRISKKKNILFAIELFKEIQTSEDISFDIYGPTEDAEYLILCEKAKQGLPKNFTVQFKGELTHNRINETLRDYHFFLFPSLHENYGHAIFEAISNSCPVILSDQTPWRNLEEKNMGWDIAFSDKKKFFEIIQKCVDMSQVEYDKMSKNAFNFAVDYSANNDVIEQTKKLFE